MSSGTKAKSKSVSLEPELWERIEAKASAKYGGNRSAYLRVLAERDLSGAFDPGAAESNAVVELARHFHPTLAGRLEAELRSRPGQPVDQGRAIARFLEALAEALGAAGEAGFNPEAPFELFSSERKFLAAVRSSPAVFAALKSVAAAAEGAEGRRFELNEGQPSSPARAEIHAEKKRRAQMAETDAKPAKPARNRARSSPA